MQGQHHCAIVDISKGTLNPADAIEDVSDPGYGGIALFVGRVRDLNRDRKVDAITYDMLDTLVVQRIRDITVALEVEYGARLKLHVAHAKGRLQVGDVAVVVAAGAPHRDEAFRACRQLIESVKHSCPIWKQEHYADGDSEWSEGCSLCLND